MLAFKMFDFTIEEWNALTLDEQYCYEEVAKFIFITEHFDSFLESFYD